MDRLLAIFILLLLLVLVGVLVWLALLLRRKVPMQLVQARGRVGFWGFWWAAMCESLSFGWGIITVVTTVLPDILAAVHKYFPDIETFGLVHWVNAHPVRAHLICAGIAVVVYLFYSAYKYYDRLAVWALAVVEQRPSFSYEASWITNRPVQQFGEQTIATADVIFQMRNLGSATAYNPLFKIYYCWLDDPSQVTKVEVDCQTFVRYNQWVTIPFQVTRPAVELGRNRGGVPILGFGSDLQVFVWIEIEARVHSEDGEHYVEELLRYFLRPLVFDNRTPGHLSLSNRRQREIADPHFERFRQAEATSQDVTPLLQGLDTGELGQSAT